MGTSVKEAESLFQKVGADILRLRNQRGLTQFALARKIGVTQQEISRVEKGDNCSLLTLNRIAEALEYDLEILFREKKS
ncbi:MAG: helix-turn-helix transcriptional regulator [Candidatus Omnitrophica bacterium]|nr:helix-turn-helix transcriptional regulator [Candidatus Omnitrophota bacterium]